MVKRQEQGSARTLLSFRLMDAYVHVCRVCIVAMFVVGGCGDIYRSVDDARVTGSLTVTDAMGTALTIVDEELTNGAEDYNQVMCATPSLLRNEVPILTLTGGPRRDLELVLRSVGDPIDASDVASNPPRIVGAISYQARNLEAVGDEPCRFELTSYREGGSGAASMHCAFRDTDTDERFVLSGEVGFHDCFRDRELVFSAGSFAEGLSNLMSGPENEGLRELTTVGVAVPVLVGAVFFSGGHGGFH